MSEHRRVTVRGGFFWIDLNQKAAIEVGGDSNLLTVENCRFWVRPAKWWHLRAWYRAWRAWIGLPDNRNPWLQ